MRGTHSAKSMAHSVSKSLGHLAPLSFSMEQAYQFFYPMLYAPCPLPQMTGKTKSRVD